jgi:hypothetical protein
MAYFLVNNSDFHYTMGFGQNNYEIWLLRLFSIAFGCHSEQSEESYATIDC